MRDSEKFDDAFDVYRGGGDGNAGTDPWDVPEPHEYDGYDVMDDVIRDNRYVFRTGLAGLICTFVPVPMVGILAVVLCIMSVARARMLDMAGYLTGHGSAGRVMARIGLVFAAVKAVIVILVTAFVIWIFYSAIMSVG